MGNFSELDAYLFGQGTHYDIYKKLGAHPAKAGGKTGVNFAVWAPHAKRVFVIGEFDYVINPVMYFVFTKLVPIYRNIIKKRSKKALKEELEKSEEQEKSNEQEKES